jgi:hypothetical protein
MVIMTILGCIAAVIGWWVYVFLTHSFQKDYEPPFSWLVLIAQVSGFVSQPLFSAY